MIDKPLWSVREVAAYLSVDEKSVYRLITSGQIPAIRIGGVYRIRREDLLAFLDQSMVTDMNVVSETNVRSPEVCPTCHRFMRGAGATGGRCEAPDCEEVLCRDCWDEIIDRRCPKHIRTPRQLLEEAQQQLERGEIQVLVSSGEARRQELDVLERFRVNISGLSRIKSPVGGTSLRVRDVDSVVDETEASVPEVSAEARRSGSEELRPRQISRMYRLGGNSAGRFSIGVASIVDLDAYIRKGFDTTPVNRHRLLTYIDAWSGRASREQVLHVIGLASPTGWEEDALEVVFNEETGRGFSDQYLSVVLLDIPSGRTISNSADTRVEHLLELFDLEMVGEAAIRIERYVADQLMERLSQSVEEVALAADSDIEQVRHTFIRMASTGQYTVEQVPGIGLVISKKY